jgi:penicillin-binding protein 1A
MKIRTDQRPCPPRCEKRKEKKEKGPRSPRRDRTPRRGRRLFFYWTAVSGLWLGIAVAVFVGYCAVTLPRPNDLKVGWGAPSIYFVARDGSPLYTAGRKRGEWLERAELPGSLVAAVLATEDRRFYTHGPIDLQGVARAALANLKAGGVVAGGSTLTQQLAKNIFLTPDRTFKRKIQEVLLSYWLEDRYTKDEILTYYLNRVYFGGGAFGADAAAQLFFGHGAHELSTAESAMLAGMLKAPSRYNPHQDPETAWARAEVVLGAMVDAGYLTPEQAAAVKPPVITKATKPGDVRYFIDWVRGQIGPILDAPGDDIFVRTTLDPQMQRAAERAVKRNLDASGKAQDASQASLLALSPDGAVRAMVGGRDYVESQFNRAEQARRQTGSAFKLFVYLTALEAGLSPETVMRDSPVTLDGWSPQNYEPGYRGEMTLEEAFAESVNTIAVKLSERVNRNKVIEMARRLGVTSPLVPHPSLALGTSALTMDELTAAYAAVANGGRPVKPYGILEVRTAGGKQLYVGQPEPRTPVLQPGDVQQMQRLLLVALSDGTGKAARLDRPAAGKTGTSQDYRDAWFEGFTADLVAGVWVGNDDNHPMKRVTGGGLPARIWHDFMMAALKDTPPAAFANAAVAIPAAASAPTVTAPTVTADDDIPEQVESRGFFRRLFGE